MAAAFFIRFLGWDQAGGPGVIDGTAASRIKIVTPSL